MTAHVVFTAIDPVAPATTSVTMVREVIRGFIGFDGLLMSDDISMGALSGTLARAQRAPRSRPAAMWCSIATASCDEMREVAGAVPGACGRGGARAPTRRWLRARRRRHSIVEAARAFAQMVAREWLPARMSV